MELEATNQDVASVEPEWELSDEELDRDVVCATRGVIIIGSCQQPCGMPWPPPKCRG